MQRTISFISFCSSYMSICSIFFYFLAFLKIFLISFFKSMDLSIKCSLSILVIILKITCILNLSKSNVYHYFYRCLEKTRTLENFKSIQATPDLYVTSVLYLFSLKTPRQSIIGLIQFICLNFTHLFPTFFILLSLATQNFYLKPLHFA